MFVTRSLFSRSKSVTFRSPLNVVDPPAAIIVYQMGVSRVMAGFVNIRALVIIFLDYFICVIIWGQKRERKREKEEEGKVEGVGKTKMKFNPKPFFSLTLKYDVSHCGDGS